MTRSRAVSGVLALLLLLGGLDSVFANVPPPWLPDGKPPSPGPNPAPPVPDPIIPSVEPQPPPPPKKVEPRRSGVFRSCGSGAGLGLAGIAVGWGMLWLGTRFVNRRPRSAEK